jgi:hypothetical protein
VPLLLATDVAARGLDIPSVDLVVNYDLPVLAADYVHRCAKCQLCSWLPELVCSLNVMCHLCLWVHVHCSTSCISAFAWQFQQFQRPLVSNNLHLQLSGQ